MKVIVLFDKSQMLVTDFRKCFSREEDFKIFRILGGYCLMRGTERLENSRGSKPHGGLKNPGGKDPEQHYVRESGL